jgi:hypothetical protein
MLASQAALFVLTGTFDMSLFQMLLEGNIVQRFVPVDAAVVEDDAELAVSSVPLRNTGQVFGASLELELDSEDVVRLKVVEVDVLVFADLCLATSVKVKVATDVRKKAIAARNANFVLNPCAFHRCTNQPQTSPFSSMFWESDQTRECLSSRSSNLG